MATRMTLLFLFISLLAQAQSNLIALRLNDDQTALELVEWQALDEQTVSTLPTELMAVYTSSSVFDDYNNIYYASGISDFAEYLFSYNAETQEQNLIDSGVYSNVTEFDMSTGKLYALLNSNELIEVYEYNLDEDTQILKGTISEPGFIGFTLGAVAMDSNNGIMYFTGVDGNFVNNLYALNVRDEVFSFSITPLTSAANSYLNALEYDNINDRLFANYTVNDENFQFSHMDIAEIDVETGIVNSIVVLEGYQGIVNASNCFDQETSSYIFVSLTAGFQQRMLVINTINNTFIDGFVPDGVTEIVCNNSEFAAAFYETNAVIDHEDSQFSLYPNPAADVVFLQSVVAMSDAQLSVFDNQGRLCFNQKLHAFQTEIAVSNLDAGAYTFRIVSSNGSCIKKVIIQP